MNMALKRKSSVVAVLTKPKTLARPQVPLETAVVPTAPRKRTRTRKDPHGAPEPQISILTKPFGTPSGTKVLGMPKSVRRVAFEDRPRHAKFKPLGGYRSLINATSYLADYSTNRLISMETVTAIGLVGWTNCAACSQHVNNCRCDHITIPEQVNVCHQSAAKYHTGT